MTSQERDNVVKELKAHYNLLVSVGMPKQDALEMIQDQARSFYETVADYNYVQSKLKKFTE